MDPVDVASRQATLHDLDSVRGVVTRPMLNEADDLGHPVLEGTADWKSRWVRWTRRTGPVCDLDDRVVVAIIPNATDNPEKAESPVRKATLGAGTTLGGSCSDPRARPQHRLGSVDLKSHCVSE